MSRRRARHLVLLAVLSLAGAPPAAAQDLPRRGEVPLEDILEIVVLEHELLSIDARGGGQLATDLRLGERVLWTGTRGQVGVVLTDRRVLAVAADSGDWQETHYRLTEKVPADVLLGARVALIRTEVRVLGYDGGSGNLVESDVGPQESVVATEVGDNVAVAVTTRRALGLSPFAGGFFPVKLRLKERLEAVSARSNFATITTSQRILIFRANTGTWEEKLLDLN